MKILRVLLVSTLFVTLALPTSAATTYTYKPATPQSQSDWYSADWKYRVKITVNHEQVGEEVTDFPMLVKITNNQKLFKNAKQDGHDLVFTSSDGITKLDHEVEAYNADNQELISWVKVPKLSVTEDTVLYAYYGNPTSEDQQKPTNVWGSYGAVYHLNNNPETRIVDSTKGGIHGTAGGGMNKNDSLRTGKIGDTLRFDGSNDYVQLPNTDNVAPGDKPLTVSSWIRSDGTTGTTQTIYWDSIGNLGNNPHVALYVLDDGTLLSSVRDANANNLNIIAGSNLKGDNMWHHVVMVVNNKQMNLYLDGRNIGSATNASLNALNTASAGVQSIGVAHSSGSLAAFFRGSISDTRVSLNAHSGGWIKTEHNNQNDPESFYTVSTEQARTISTLSNTVFTTPVYTYTTLTSFTEKAIKNTGTILYQLSPDNGKTWYYRKNNHDWTKTIKTTDGNPAWAINTGIAHLPVGTGKLKIRAYLKPKNEKPVSLEQLQVGYTK